MVRVAVGTSHLPIIRRVSLSARREKETTYVHHGEVFESSMLRKQLIIPLPFCVPGQEHRPQRLTGLLNEGTRKGTSLILIVC